MEFVLCCLYLLFGLFLAVPYCFVAGWDINVLPVVSFAAPAFFVVWLILAAIAGIVSPDHGKRLKVSFNWKTALGKSEWQSPPYSLFAFWLWLLYGMLPIILHWTGVGLKRGGLVTVGSIIERYRYQAPVLVLMMILVILAVIAFSIDMRKRKSVRHE